MENRFIGFTRELAGDELDRLLPEITDKMSLSQVESVLARLMEEVDPGPARRVARFKLVRRWAQLDPRAALEHIAAMHDPKLRHDLRLEGIEGWASSDPAAALAFATAAEGQSVTKSKEAVRAGFATMRDLDAAFSFASKLGSETTPDPQWSTAMAVEALFQNNDLAVVRWVEDLPNGALREQAVTGLIGQWARHDPEAARKWLEQHADPATLARHREFIDKLASHAR